MPLRADRLKELRRRRNFTQQDMADRLQIKQPQYADWERSKYDPRADVVAKLSRILGCTADYLLGLVDEPTRYTDEQELPPDERRLLQLYRERRVPRVLRELLADPHLFSDDPEPPRIDRDSDNHTPRQ